MYFFHVMDSYTFNEKHFAYLVMYEIMLKKTFIGHEKNHNLEAFPWLVVLDIEIITLNFEWSFWDFLS